MTCQECLLVGIIAFTSLIGVMWGFGDCVWGLLVAGLISYWSYFPKSEQE